MSILLDRARKVFRFGGSEPLPEEPFALKCLCGRELAGIRQEDRQFIRCSDCGHLLLVLPISPYPLPPPPLPEGEAQPKAERREPWKLAIAQRLRIGWGQLTKRVVAQTGQLVPRKESFTRGRMLTLGIPMLVALTVWLTSYLGGRDRFSEEIQSARADWAESLRQGDFHAASEALRKATRLLERFGEGGRDEREIWHLSRETELYANRLERELDDLIAELRRAATEEPHANSTALPGSGSVLFDFTINVPDATDPLGTTRALPLLAAGDPVYLDLESLNLLDDLKIETAKRILFGARIQSIEPRGPRSAGWLLRFVPDSGILLTSPRCLEKAGWPVDAATRSLLENQHQWVLERAIEH